jgi:hypothetical protein
MMMRSYGMIRKTGGRFSEKIMLHFNAQECVNHNRRLLIRARLSGQIAKARGGRLMQGKAETVVAPIGRS